jgi:hypothetical protein
VAHDACDEADASCEEGVADDVADDGVSSATGAVGDAAPVL